MPYASIADPALPPAVQKLPRKMRELWVRVFNDSYDETDEGAAFRAAWGAVRAADKEKKMTSIKQIVASLRKPAEKAVNLSNWRMAVEQAFAKEFGVEPGEVEEMENVPWVYEVYDDHLVTRDAAGWHKVPYAKTMAQVDGADEEVVASVTFAPRAEWVPVVPVFSTFKAYTQADGRVRWTLASSGGFEDRDGEIVSTAFLESAVALADRTKERGPLLIWHVPGSNIGTVDFQGVIGEPGILLESGLFDDTPDGRRAAEYYGARAKETGASIKFFYAKRTPDGIFEPPGVIVERSLLPRDKAAFPWSALDISEVPTMAKLSQEKQRMLAEVLGEDRAVEIIAQVESSAEALKEAGVRFKELGASGGDGATTNEAAGQPDTTPTDPEPVLEEAKEIAPAAQDQPTDFELVLSTEAIDAVAEKAAGAVASRLQGIEAQFGQLAAAMQSALNDQTVLRTVVEKMAQDLEALKRDDEVKVAEKVAHLPKATVRAMQAPQLYRASQAKAASDQPDAVADSAASSLDLLMQTIHG